MSDHHEMEQENRSEVNMDIMTSGDLKGILDVLSFMEESEKAIAEFYRVCCEIWPNEQEFWSNIEDEEKKHIQHIEKMKEIISKKPERFEKGRPFNILAAQTVINGIQSNIQRVKTGQLLRNNALFVARDSEQSLMEYRYNEIVKTEDVEYLGLAKEIMHDTSSHKNRIENEIKNKRLNP